MMTKEQLDTLLIEAILLGHKRLADLCKRKVLPIGAPVYCRVVWSKAHRGEPFLLCGTEPETPIELNPLNEDAVRRIAKCGDTFQRWWSVQDIHEQFIFILQAGVQVVKYNRSADVLLPTPSSN